MIKVDYLNQTVRKIAHQDQHISCPLLYWGGSIHLMQQILSSLMSHTIWNTKIVHGTWWIVTV